MTATPNADAGIRPAAVDFAAGASPFDTAERLLRCDDDIDAAVYESPLVNIGMCRIGSDSPRWRQSAETGDRPVIVFSRTPFLIRTPRGERIMADANRAVFANPRQPFFRERLGRQGEANEWFQFDGATVCDLVARFDPSVAERPDRPLLNPTTLVAPADYLEQRRIFKRAISAQADSMEIEESVIRLFGRLIASSFRPAQPRAAARRRSTQAAHRDLVVAIREILALRFAEPLTLSLLSRQVHVAPYHLCRLFSHYEGLPVHVYLNRLRLRAAMDQHEAGRMRLSEIAISCGFSSASHFSSAFRREFGVSPSTALQRKLLPQTASKQPDAIMAISQGFSARP